MSRPNFSMLVGVGGGHLRIDFGKSRLTLVKSQTCHEVFRHRQSDIDWNVNFYIPFAGLKININDAIYRKLKFLNCLMRFSMRYRVRKSYHSWIIWCSNTRRHVNWTWVYTVYARVKRSLTCGEDILWEPSFLMFILFMCTRNRKQGKS